MTPLQAYRADVAFLTPEGTERSLDAVYDAPSDHDAVAAAWRFARGRIRAFPDTFVLLACVKVSVLSIGEVGPEGELQTRTGFPFHEWKYDWGVPPFDAGPH